MVNKDYILRLAESFGRTLSIVLGLRKFNRNEEALIYIDDVFLKTVGLTSNFINSLSEDMLVRALSPMGRLNIDSCLWAAVLLKAEGEIYEEMGNANESYYRYIKSLNLFLAALSREPSIQDTDLHTQTTTLLDRLSSYDLPTNTKQSLLAYYEQFGQYNKAEDTLFDMLEAGQADHTIFEYGRAFYARLQARSDNDLLSSNFSRDEIREGLEHLERLASP
jgi:tetratricopeptide (TPR) repeat protein